jgi:hypothetical protein
VRPLPSVVAIACLTLAAGCGGDKEASPEQEVRSVLTTFATATEKRDYRTICTRVFAPSLLRGLREIGLPCEVAMRNSLGKVREPRLTIGTVTVKGKVATAEVRTSAAGQDPSSDVVRLDRVRSDWKISALSGGDRPAAPGATPTEEEMP